MLASSLAIERFVRGHFLRDQQKEERQSKTFHETSD